MALRSYTLNSSKGGNLKRGKQIYFVRDFLLGLPEVVEKLHFEKTSFTISNKIIASFDEKFNRLSVKFSEKDQDLFSLIDNSVIYPVPNKWGKRGWTFVHLDKLSNNIIKNLLTSAYNSVAPKRLKIISNKN